MNPSIMCVPYILKINKSFYEENSYQLHVSSPTFYKIIRTLKNGWTFLFRAVSVHITFTLRESLQTVFHQTFQMSFAVQRMGAWHIIPTVSNFHF
jgi:hypothetical protein